MCLRLYSRANPRKITNATDSEWKRQWRHLHRWTTEEIARQLTEYRQSVPQHDKDPLVSWNSVQVSSFNDLNVRPPVVALLNPRVSPRSISVDTPVFTIRIIKPSQLPCIHTPCAVEIEVRAYFDAGIVATHRDAVSNDNGQPFPSDPHSVFQPWRPNVVYGESDYLLVNQQSREAKGVCEEKSPWNVGPAQIDQVLLGTKTRIFHVLMVQGWLCQVLRAD